MQPSNDVELLTFEFPPKKTFFTTGGKSIIDAFKDGLLHPMDTMDTYYNAYFGEKQKIPFAITYGDCSQASFTGPFTGNQCTSMCIAALAWWQKAGYHGSFTASDMGLVLRAGDRLHTTFRDELKLSTNEDGRVSIDDLPKRLEIGLFGSLSLLTKAEDDEFIVTSPADNMDAFTPLQSYLKKRVQANEDMPEGYLLTLGEYSNAVMYTKHGTWLWFDSHGRMRVSNTTCKDRGAVVELESLEHLVMFIVALRGPAEIGQMVPITCRDTGTDADICTASPVSSATVTGDPPREDQIGAASEVNDKEGGVTETAPPTGCLSETVSTARNLCVCDSHTTLATAPVELLAPDEDEEDESVFVSFMGGFGYDE